MTLLLKIQSAIHFKKTTFIKKKLQNDNQQNFYHD